MTGPEDRQPPAGVLGGETQLVDAARWRDRAAGADADLATLRRTALGLRADVDPLDLGGSARALAALAEGSHALARMVQADLRATRTLRAAGVPVTGQLVSQFPSEPGSLRAGTTADGSWTLEGTQRRTVHPHAVDGALVSAATPAGERLFLVRTDAPGFVRESALPSLIAPVDPNGPVTFAGVPATPVGTVEWWSGRRASWDDLLIDVACWFGACVWVCRAVEATLATRTDPRELQRIGRLDVWVYAARLAIRAAVPVIEPDPTSHAAEIAARRAAATVTTTTDTVIRLAAALSDPRLSGGEGILPSRVAQLQISLRRSDPDANLRALGRLLVDGPRVGPDGRG